MDDNIDSRIAQLNDWTIEKQLEFANNERIKLAIQLANQDKVIADLRKEIMWLTTKKDNQ